MYLHQDKAYSQTLNWILGWHLAQLIKSIPTLILVFLSPLRQLSCVRAQWLSCVWLIVTPWTAVHRAPLSMGFSRQEYWRGLPFSSPETTLKKVQITSMCGSALEELKRKYAVQLCHKTSQFSKLRGFHLCICFSTAKESLSFQQFLRSWELLPWILISAMLFFSSQTTTQKAFNLANSLKWIMSLSLEDTITANRQSNSITVGI